MPHKLLLIEPSGTRTALEGVAAAAPVGEVG